MSSLENPVVALGLGLALGVYLSAGLGSSYPAVLPFSAFAAAAAGVTLLLSPPAVRRPSVPRRGEPSLSRGFLLVLAASGFFAGAALARYRFLRENAEGFGMPADEVVRIEGVALEDSRPVRNGAFVRVRAERAFDRRGNRASARADIAVFFPDNPRVHWGELVELRGRAGTGRGGVFFADGGGLLRRNAPSRIFALRAAALRRAETVIEGLGGPWSGLLAALLLGVQEDLDSSAARAFQRAGAVHILALSGMHLGIIALFLRFFLRPLFGPRAGNLVSLLFILFYTFLAGPKPSLLRAALMFCLYIMFSGIGRRPETMVLLVVSFIASCLLRAKDLLLPSFILSHLAMAGILLGTRRIQRFLRPAVPEPLLSPLAVSLAAQLATAPYLLFRFGVLYPAGIPASVVLGPLIAAFLWAGLLAFPLAGLFPWAAPLLWGLQFLLKYLYTAIVTTVEFFARFPAWGGG